jgi:hypothetical protein
MAPPARASPSPQSRTPVSPVTTANTIMTGASKSSGAPCAISRSINAATRAAVTAAVAPSGPAMANGSELRNATTAEAIAVVRKVAAMP